MSATPTYASLLTRLFSGTPDDRDDVVLYLRDHPDAAAAVEQDVRDRLRDAFPGMRTVAADAVFRVYGDSAAAVETIAGLLKLGDPAVSAGVLDVLAAHDPPAVGPLVVLVARHTPELFAARSAGFHRWAGAAAVRSGPDGPKLWTELVGTGTTDATPPLLMGVADAAAVAGPDLGPLEPVLRGLLRNAPTRVAAGAALWRVTWRVNRDWLAALDPGAPAFEVDGLRALVTAVLIEHLGSRPDLAGLVRDMLVAVAWTDGLPAATPLTGRLKSLGPRGWGVLLRVLDRPRPEARFVTAGSLWAEVFAATLDRPAVLPLVHHHAHRVIAVAAAEGRANDLVPTAARVLAELGPAAGTAVPDLLDLAVRAPAAGPVVGAVLPKVARGLPGAAAAVVRTLHRLRTAADFGADHLAAFEALARALAELDPDAAPKLAENAAVDLRIPDLLLQQPPWKDAAPETRRRHAGLLADRLGSPRPEVRVRAAGLLRHYRDQLPAVWPALVAVLAGADEAVSAVVLPLLRPDESGADAAVGELVALFGEPNPVYAARAAVALSRLGRLGLVAADLRAAVEAGPEAGWGWVVLRGAIDRAGQEHRLFGELKDLFAASPPPVAETVEALLYRPESETERRLTACVPRPDDPITPEVRWDEVYEAVKDDAAAGPLLFVALMCEYGSAGLRSQKIWLIKAQRELTGAGLVEAKGIVERVIDGLPAPGAPAAARRRAVREWFTGRTELPPEPGRLLDHPVSWYRWAGLELADAWGLTPEQAKELTADRVWDRNQRVRERALRMVRV